MINYLLDDGSFRPWDDGTPESVITGEGLLKRHRVAVVASDFGYQGGSIGAVAGERLTRAAERATMQRLPLIALPASGGTRMQEGTAAFLQMLKVAAAVTRHKGQGLPYLVYLRHPTTGGVLASWASLGHLTLAEPGALIGFLGPRVVEALAGEPFPKDVQTAEHLHAAGLIDAVIPAAGLAPYLARVLEALTPSPGARVPGGNPVPPPERHPAPAPSHDTREHDPWQHVLTTRRRAATAAEFLSEALSGMVTVADAGGLLLCLGRVAGAERGGMPVVGVCQRGSESFGMKGLDLARRGMSLAQDLRMPLISVIDTPGAELSVAAEEGGIARAIARCLAGMLELRTPTVAVLLGQGTGGGALALLPADRVIAAPHAWLAPLAPEGASAIVYRDTAHAAEMARSQGITAADLAALGVADQVVPDSGLAAALAAELASLSRLDDGSRLAARMRRFRSR